MARPGRNTDSRAGCRLLAEPSSPYASATVRDPRTPPLKCHLRTPNVPTFSFDVAFSSLLFFSPHLIFLSQA